jgi:sec-independent protein translocase protein TatB
VFGLSFGEILLLLVVGIIVVGPKNLPTMMRTAGQWIGRLRRMSSDLRSQSGIDDLIRQEGLEREIHELRSLSRVNLVDTLITPALSPAPAVPTSIGSGHARRPPDAPARAAPPSRGIEPLREREYPVIGCDAYGALPDDATPYRPPPPDEIPEDERQMLAAREGKNGAPVRVSSSPEIEIHGEEEAGEAEGAEGAA